MFTDDELEFIKYMATSANSQSKKAKVLATMAKSAIDLGIAPDDIDMDEKIKEVDRFLMLSQQIINKIDVPLDMGVWGDIGE